MHALIQPFVRICLLRKGPQDLPTSEVLLVITLAAYTTSGILASFLRLAPGDALLAGMLDTLLMCGLTIALLHIRQHRARINQTLTALAGSGALMTVLALPCITWVDRVIKAGGEPGVGLIAFWLLVVWSFAVMGHVIRHALSVPFFKGVIIAFGFYFVSFQVQNSFFDLSP